MKVTPATPAPSGTFDVKYDGSAWETVTYSGNTTTMAANIQTALTTLFGTGVAVAYENGGDNWKNYRITFSGALANQNIADLTINWVNLVDATAKPYNITQGQAAVSEAQRVELVTDAAAGTFTLDWTHSGTTYTTAAIAFSATQTQVQAALDTALTGLAGAAVGVTFWNGQALEVEFGGNLAGVDVSLMNATVTPTAAAATLAQTQTGSTVVEPGHAAYALVVDYDPSNLDITTGPGTTITLDIDGAKGEYLFATGNATIDLFGFVSVTGGFGVEKKTSQSIVVSDFQATETRETVTANLLTIGLANVSAFVGDSVSGLGLNLTGVDLAIALWSEVVLKRHTAQVDERDGQHRRCHIQRRDRSRLDRHQRRSGG